MVTEDMGSSEAGTSGGDNGLSALLQRVFEQQKASGFPGVAGTNLQLLLPIRQGVLDALLAARPRRSDGAVRGIRLYLAARDRIALEVDLRLPLFSRTVRIEADVQRHVPFPHDGKLRLMLQTGAMLRLIVNVFPVPDYVRIDGSLVEVDLGLLLRRGGLDWLVPRISRFQVNVHPGVLWLEIGLTVPADRPATAVLPPSSE